MNDLGRYLLAGALFLCWAILLATWNLLASSAHWPLALCAWLSFAAAVAILIPGPAWTQLLKGPAEIPSFDAKSERPGDPAAAENPASSGH